MNIDELIEESDFNKNRLRKRGLGAEYFVASYLSFAGFEVIFSNGGMISDLIISNNNTFEKVLKIQVKSSVLKKNKKRDKSFSARYNLRRNTKKDNSEVIKGQFIQHADERLYKKEEIDYFALVFCNLNEPLGFYLLRNTGSIPSKQINEGEAVRKFNDLKEVLKNKPLKLTEKILDNKIDCETVNYTCKPKDTLNLAQVMDVSACTEREIYRYIEKGIFPKAIWGKENKYWKKSDIELWFDTRERITYPRRNK